MEVMIKLVLLLMLIQHMEANCRPVPDTLLNFGDFFVPNPTRLTENSGVITSSNYPEDYNVNEQCGFIIEGPQGSRIKLEMTDYDISADAVFGVFDGNLSPYGGVYTPYPSNTSSIPADFISNTNIVAINFSTGPDLEQTASGWRLLYSIITRSQQDQPILVIDSATSTFLMAVLSVLFIFISGFLP